MKRMWRIPFARAVVSLAIALILVSYQSSDALAAFDARPSAVLVALDKLELDDAEHDAIEDALEDYFDDRERCLEALLKLLESKDEREQEPAFVNRAESCHSSGAKLLGEALDDLDEPSGKAIEFLATLKVEENKFFVALRKLSVVAQQRDAIVALKVRMREKTDALVEKWYGLEGRDQSVDKDLSDAVVKIDNQVEKLIEATARQLKTAKQKWAAAVHELGENRGAAGLPGVAGVAVEAGRKAVGAAAGKLLTFSQQARQFAAAMVNSRRSEVGILAIFNTVREDVEEFLEVSDFPIARQAFEQATNWAHGFVGNVSAPGQKDDASDFRKDAVDSVADRLEEAEEIFKKFVANNEKKFFGPVGPNIKEALIEKRDTDRWRRMLQAHGLEAKLRAWHSEADNLLGVDISGLTKEQRAELRRRLEPVLEEYAEAIEESGDEYSEALEELEERERLESEID